MLFVVRSIGKDGIITGKKLSEPSFHSTFKSCLESAGYVSVSASLHAIRRFLGKQIDGMSLSRP